MADTAGPEGLAETSPLSSNCGSRVYFEQHEVLTIEFGPNGDVSRAALCGDGVLVGHSSSRDSGGSGRCNGRGAGAVNRAFSAVCNAVGLGQ